MIGKHGTTKLLGFSIVVVGTFILSGCLEGDAGPQGPPGTDGVQGPAGPANITQIDTGLGLTGGLITTTGTIDLKLSAAGGLDNMWGASSDELGIIPGSVDGQILRWDNSAVMWVLDLESTNADTLDSLDSTAFALMTHNHDAGYVNLNGDTMTGLLTLSGDPTVSLHATTKQYVDTANATQDAVIATSWQTGGNAGLIDGTDNILGTTDNVALEFLVNNARALRIEPTAAADAPNIIGGHSANSVTAGVVGATIAGGGFNDGTDLWENRVFDDYGTIGGGWYNRVGSDDANTTNATFATVGGGAINNALAIYSTVGGGYGNTASLDYATVGGGGSNAASGWDSTVGGGYQNTASNWYATIGGGGFNTASGGDATIGGGFFNSASGYDSTIGGGYINTASMNFATVGGGGYNTASGWYSTVGGGYTNTASGGGSTIGGGGSNTASWGYATVGGGYWNTASDSFATASGGYSNLASGYCSTIGGGYGNIANDDSSTVAGGWFNTAEGWKATVGGGVNNTASGLSPTVGGGQGNTANANFPTVGGGVLNTASGESATVSGGYDNTADGEDSTVGGGRYNTASGWYATVPGGYVNTAAGDYSFAAGLDANVQAAHSGTFLWADNQGGFTAFDSAAANEFAARATGGVRFVTKIDGAGSPTQTTQINLADGTWEVISDRNRKKNFQEMDGGDVLGKIARMPITMWNYNWESNDSVPHIGPVAQDFKALFYPGRDDKTISTLEFDGVELAAIKALEKRTAQLQQENAALKTALKRENAALKARIARLEAALLSADERR